MKMFAYLLFTLICSVVFFRIGLLADRKPALSPVVLSDNPVLVGKSNPAIGHSDPTGKYGNPRLEKIIKDIDDDFGVVVYDVSTGKTYQKNERAEYEPASLYKLWVMAAAFDDIEHGLLTPETELLQDVSELNKKFQISEEYAELTDGTISLSVSEALDKMITVSDNYAALILSEKIQNSRIQYFMQRNGFTGSSLGTPPKTTANDIFQFFRKLHAGTLVSKSASEHMLSLLKKQSLNHKIPKLLPAGTVIAHKTGELGEFTHDAGIIYGNQHTFILVIMSRGDDRETQENKIRDIAGNIYASLEN